MKILDSKGTLQISVILGFSGNVTIFRCVSSRAMNKLNLSVRQNEWIRVSYMSITY